MPPGRKVNSSHRSLDLISWGYAAPVTRIRVDSFPEPPLEGKAGVQLLPSIKCDAPIVALALAQHGGKVLGAFNHPGVSRESTKLVDLVTERLENLVLGPAKGSPLEFQILDEKGRAKWFSDPSPALRSLEELSLSQYHCKWLYMDCFPWLYGVMKRNNAPKVIEGLFLNFGNIHPSKVKKAMEKWYICDPKKVVCQISLGALRLSQEKLFEYARIFSSGNDVIYIVTSSDLGLCISSNEVVHFQSATPVYPGVYSDSTGAGAAVSAAYLITELIGNVSFSSRLAEILAGAGADQCQIAGSLGRLDAKDWSQRIDKEV